MNNLISKCLHFLREILKLSELNNPLNKQNTIYVIKKLTTLQLIHSYLIKCVTLVSSIFGLQAMLCIGISYTFTFFTFFSIYKASIDIQSEAQKNLTISNIYWCLYLNIVKLSMLAICCLTENQNYETTRLSKRLMNRPVCDMSLLQSLANQSSGQSSKTGCGLFYFDCPLVGMVNE